MTNPIFSSMENNETEYSNVQAGYATYKGITFKTMFLVGIAILSAVITAVMMWGSENLYNLVGGLVIASIVGFIAVMIGRTSPRKSAVCGVIYAVCEGMFIGVVSLIGEIYYSGIVLMAGITTGVIFLSMLGIFASGIIRNKSKFVSFGISFGSSMIVLCLVMLIMSFFNAFNPLFDNLFVIIGVEALFLVYGCVTLLMNFVEATAIVQGGCDKTYEWSCSLGLLVSVLYIYVEVLRILIYVLSLLEKD